MFSLNPMSSGLSVTVDGPAGRPLEIRHGGERIVVTALEAVRHETAAYPLETGPRTVFVVRGSQRRYRLVHLLRERSWTVEELLPGSTGLTRVA